MVPRGYPSSFGHPGKQLFPPIRFTSLRIGVSLSENYRKRKITENLCYSEWKLIVSLYVTYRKVGGVFYIVEFGNHNQKFESRHANLSSCHHLWHRLACPSPLPFPGLNLQDIPTSVDCKF